MKKLLSLVSLSAFLLLAASAWSQDAGQQFEGFNLQGFKDDGQKHWDLKGETADIVGDKIRITNVDANQYGEQEMNLTAQVGVVDKVSGNVHLEKDVVITSELGSQIKTESLDWEKEKDLVSTEDRVELIDKAISATGTGIKASPGLKTAELDRDITIKVQKDSATPQKEEITITCDGPMEVDQNKHMAILKENVVAVQLDRTLRADEIEVYFDPETQDVQRMICVGNVEIIQGANRTRSDRAVYDATTKKLILSGRPKLILVTTGEGMFSPSSEK